MILENKDCLKFIREIDDESVDLILTDPPYYIGYDGGKGWCSIDQINFVIKKAGITASSQKYKSWLQKKGCFKCKRKDEQSGKRVNVWINMELNQGKKEQMQNEDCLID